MHYLSRLPLFGCRVHLAVSAARRRGDGCAVAPFFATAAAFISPFPPPGAAAMAVPWRRSSQPPRRSSRRFRR